MKETNEYNVLVSGVSCFDGMASSTRVRNLIEPLVEKGFISVFNLIYTPEYKSIKTATSGVSNHIRFKVIAFRNTNLLASIPFLLKGMVAIKKNKAKNKKNIFYQYDHPNAKNILFLLFAKMIGYKIVFDIVEDYTFFKQYSSRLNRFRTVSSNWLLKMSPYLASSYVVISSHLYTKVRALAGNKVPVRLIPVTVNFKYFQQVPSSANNSEVKIFYGGSFGKKDGLQYLISAFDAVCTRHNNIRLFLSGKGLQADMEEVFGRITHLKCKDKIEYKGYLDTSEYYALLNDCDIFCMARIDSGYSNAGFPFKLGEFLASGKGVVATRVGDVPSYLTNGQNALLVEAESISQLVDAITYLLDNPQKRRDMGEQGRKTASQHFDSEKLSMELLDVFSLS
ncbi:MAG TPA: glycosyltransferase [Chitinophagaceae bacterium]|nr:glycosyltransferase [Chitinophagaceae bacterium]